MDDWILQKNRVKLMSIAAMLYVAIFVLCTSTIAVILGNELIVWWRTGRKPKS